MASESLGPLGQWRRITRPDLRVEPAPARITTQASLPGCGEVSQPEPVVRVSRGMWNVSLRIGTMGSRNQECSRFWAGLKVEMDLEVFELI